MRLLLRSIVSCGCLSFAGWHLRAAPPPTPAFASGYKLAFSQDFTAMTSLSNLGVSATAIGTGAWIAHTPNNRDFFTFENPSASYKPFGVGNGYLDIRVQQDGNDPTNLFGGYSGGLLSSMDSTGAGFAQQYGYFECSMWTPAGANTWPAFWLLSAPNLTNPGLPYLGEVDVMEAYGNFGTGPNQNPPGNPNAFSVGWHNWAENGGQTTQGGSFLTETGLTSGYHLYGVDIEPSGISWYFDRQLVWQAPIFAAVQQPMVVLLDLALGGGNFNNAGNTGYNWALTPNPSDLMVQYVAVWASPSSPNYSGAAPPAVSGLAAGGGNAQVALSWTAVPQAASYNIYRGTSSGGEVALATGILITSYLDTSVANGVTYYYEVTAVNTSGASPVSNEVSSKPSAGGNLPSPWLNQDVGITWPAGSSTYANGTFTLQGSGSGAFFAPDAFQYAYQAITGDCSIVARVAAQANSNPFAHAGVIIRDGLADNSGFVEMTLLPAGGGAYFQYRPDGGSPGNVSGTGAAPLWVKLTRSGNLFTGYVSLDGSTWTTVGSTNITFSSAVYIGLLQASNVYAALATAIFDNVSVTGAGPVASGPPPSVSGLVAAGGNAQVTLSWNAVSQATSYNVYRGTSSGGEISLATGITITTYVDTPVVNGVAYYYEVAAVNASGASAASNEVTATPAAGGNLPSPWVNQDVGTTWPAGSATYANGTFTLQGSGSGAFFVPDAFQYVYQTITGDGSIVARVAAQDNSNPFAHAGVIIRDGLAGNSGFVEMTLLPAGGGAYFQYRPDGGNPGNVSGTGSAPLWIKLTRSGNLFTGYVSADGSVWTTVGSATMTLPSAVYIGLLQASNVYAALATASFDNISITTSGH